MPDTPVRKLKINCPGCQTHLDVTELPPFSVFSCPRCGIEVKVPQYWNNYVLEDPLLTEPHRAVYRSLDTALDREVCIEMLLPAGNYTDDESRTYQKILRSLAQLNLPACCAIYNCAVTSDNIIYSVTEYIPKHLPLSAPQSWQTLSEWLLQCCLTLSQTAANGICHGALSADCMYLRENGQLCLGGFGLGMIRPVSTSQPLTPADDIFTLGKIFSQATETLPAGTVPIRFEKLLHEMTNPDKSARPTYQTMLAFLQAPNEKQGKSRGKVQFHKIHTDKMPSPQQAEKPSSNAKLAFLLIIVLIVASAAGAWFWFVRNKDLPVLQFTVPSVSPTDSDTSSELSDTIDEAEIQAEQKTLPPIALEQSKWTPLTSEQRATRPRPQNPQVYQSRRVRQWLNQLPEAYREGAILQARLLMNLHDMISAYVQRINYDRGSGTTVLLRDGQKYNACIAFGNEHGMRLKSLNGKDIPDYVTFEQLSRRTIQDMMVFYGEYSLSRLNKSDPEYSKAQRALVKHYLILALLCDWYGETDNASRFAGICIHLQPKSEKLFSQFGLKPLPYVPIEN